MRFPQGTIHALLSAADHFAELHPAIAGRLGGTSLNGRLERLRRAVFAVGASILERMSELEEESLSAPAAVVDPSSTRPFPSATIVQLSATDDAVHHVRAGAEVTAARGERFRVASPLDVGPFRIQNATASGTSLQFELVATQLMPLRDAISDELRIYVDGPPERAFLLVMHMLTHTAHIELSVPGRPTLRLDSHVIPYGERPEDLLAPEIDGPPNMTGLLREYFLIPQKFNFAVIRGLRVALLDSGAKIATITLNFSTSLPAGFTIANSDLKANCVPVVNLFSASSEPQTFGPGTSCFRVHVAGLPRRMTSVYDVLSATATPCDGSGPPIPLPPVRRFAAEAFSSEFPYAYSMRRVSGSSTDPALMLALTSPKGTPPLLEPHVISLRVLATNGPCNLAPGDISEAGFGMDPSIQVRSVLPTSPYVPASVGADLAFRTFMRGAIPRDPLFALKSLLFSLLPPETVGQTRANVDRVHAIQQLHVAPVVDDDGSRLVYENALEIDEIPFLGLGHVGLLVRLLQEVFSAHVAVNGSCRTRAVARKAGLLIRWPASQKAPPRKHRHPCARLPSIESRPRLPRAPRAVRLAKPLTLEALSRVIPQYDFFDAARVVEAVANGNGSLVQFGQSPSLAYPISDVAELTIKPHEVRLQLRFLGLVGTASPLSASWTEDMLHRDDDGLFRGLLDVLHNPLAQCLYKAWQSRAIEGGFDLAGRDSQSRILRSIAGVDASIDIVDDALPGMVALGLADHQRAQPHATDIRSAEQLLQRLLPWPISLEPNVHRVTIRTPAEMARLGRRGKLGVDFIYGEEREDIDGLVRLHVGPVDRATYEDLMPGGDGYVRLERLTTRIFDAKVAVELEVHVREEVPAWKLGTGRLGVDAYYLTDGDEAIHVRVPLLQDPENVVRQFVKPTIDRDDPC